MRELMPSRLEGPVPLSAHFGMAVGEGQTGHFRPHVTQHSYFYLGCQVHVKS